MVLHFHINLVWIQKCDGCTIEPKSMCRGVYNPEILFTFYFRDGKLPISFQDNNPQYFINCITFQKSALSDWKCITKHAFLFIYEMVEAPADILISNCLQYFKKII